VEARSAQNSADATVLAVATDCARHGRPIADYTPYRKTGQSISRRRLVRERSAAITVTKDVAGTLPRPQRPGTVARSGHGKMGNARLGHDGADRDLGLRVLAGAARAATDITCTSTTRNRRAAARRFPGGFSQLAKDGCSVRSRPADRQDGKARVPDLQKQVPCITNPTTPALPHDVLIPMYDAAACQAADCKGNGPYPIEGFAMFRVTGYSFNGNNYAGSLGKKCPDKDRGKYCIQGDFIKYVTSIGTPGAPAPTSALPDLPLQLAHHISNEKDTPQ
jgi:hypothetical protein